VGRELMGGLTNDVRRFWWAVLAIALPTIVTRLPSLLHPQAIDDEETYSVVANVIVDGGWPYVDAVERKPPLLFTTIEALASGALRPTCAAAARTLPGIVYRVYWCAGRSRSQ